MPYFFESSYSTWTFCCSSSIVGVTLPVTFGAVCAEFFLVLTFFLGATKGLTFCAVLSATDLFREDVGGEAFEGPAPPPSS